MLIAAHASQGEAPECQDIVIRMRAHSLAPNLVTFAGLLTAHVVRREFGAVRTVFEEMRTAAPFSSAFDAILSFCNLKSDLRQQGTLYNCFKALINPFLQLCQRPANES